MSADQRPDRRWPRSVYGVGEEPDPRWSLANERTFLAWIRTSLGFLATGVAVTAVARLTATLALEARLLSVLMTICCGVCVVGGTIGWVRAERAMRLGRPLPAAPAMSVLAAVVLLVAVALVVGLL